MVWLMLVSIFLDGLHLGAAFLAINYWNLVFFPMLLLRLGDSLCQNLSTVPVGRRKPVLASGIEVAGVVELAFVCN